MAINTLVDPIPSPVKQTTDASYLDMNNGWAQQYLPELYEAEVERYGNRSLSGFLAKVGAEEAMQSDKVVWSEQGRLHISIPDVSLDESSSIIGFDDAAEAGLIRKHDTLLMYCTAGTKVGTTVKVLVTAIEQDSLASGTDTLGVKVAPYDFASMANGDSGYDDTSVFTVMVYGSEYKKGSTADRHALTPGFLTFDNKPIIMRDMYQINGSDTAQIGWVEVSGEEGQNGYMWYLKAEGDTRARFNDYLEMSMIEARKAASGSAALAAINGSIAGTEGLLQAIENRGHISTDTFVATTSNPAADAVADLAYFDDILVKLDGQGAIEENMLYLDRHDSLNFDNMLAGVSIGSAGGTAYGLFDNSSDMALNLGFIGFRRGSYDFYKSDWKYLNNVSAHGAHAALAGNSKLSGVLCPAGTSSVYDETMGTNVKRPFIHVRYRASQTDNRRLKTWVTGSVGGNITSDLDAMTVNYLTERCLVVQAANNFMKFVR
jgi:hypothetical protein